VGYIIRPTIESALNLTSTFDVSMHTTNIEAEIVRWIYASIYKHVEGFKGEYSLYMEADERNVMDFPKFAELRIDGPKIRTAQRRYKKYSVEINILCSTHTHPVDLYAHQNIVGHFARALEKDIPVYRYGDGTLDDGSLVGCFVPQRHWKEHVAIDSFGHIRHDTKIEQSTIEGHYIMERWTGEN